MTTILVVEDSGPSRDALVRHLEARQYAVITAGDNSTGLARARESQPDLILLDLATPGMDGWNATAELKTHPATRHIPVIVLSSLTQPNERHRALAAGGDDLDSKPVEFDRLLAKIETLLASSSGFSKSESASGI